MIHNHFSSCEPLPIDLSFIFIYFFLFIDIQNSTLFLPPAQESSSFRVAKVKTIVVKTENRGNLYHWPTTIWLRSSSLCSCENEARPHTEAELQHFKKKKKH